ncbi:MAG: histidine--tRNA ligase [Candidatus Doudnabacteria bacterium]|nr:histidine--tRNA ligase [Candidatus Doudnabacteria bacterium]
MPNLKKLSVDPYKGTRDFYPKEQFIQNYIFDVWRKVAQRYGYLEYGASIIEETDLYRAKTGEEIVNEQTYSFTDRGGRDVTIRPEMTPTVARMVAQKRKELIFPLRWFSIPNLFRYERPQRGRLREHWQLNCDIFGVDSIEADAEIISLAYDIMKEFGAKDENFVIRLNNRRAVSSMFQSMGLSEGKMLEFRRLLDKRDKIKDFDDQAKKILGKPFNPSEAADKESLIAIKKLSERGINNIKFDPYLVRGFDYYTGTVFEMYDTNPKNPRALFGGGRYDDLVSIFGVEKVSGVGFGWGDVTTRDFLETYNLLPEYKPPVQLYICHLGGYIDEANKLARYLRSQNINVGVDLTDRKVTAQIKTADREFVPYVVVVGEEEVKSGNYKVKSLKDGNEREGGKSDIVNFVRGIK